LLSTRLAEIDSSFLVEMNLGKENGSQGKRNMEHPPES